jgi:hypothetical protein
MYENRFTSHGHENNGQGNGVLHEALPGTGTLPAELLGGAAKAAGERALNGPSDGDGTQSVSAVRSQAEPGNEGEASASRAASAAGASAAGERSPRGDGRDAQGRLRPGNPGGPGNPYARQVALVKQELLGYCTPEDRREIMHAMIERAKAGDVQAAKFVYAYTAGKPTPGPDPDRLDAQEWQGLRESSTWMEEAPKILSAPSGSMALHLVRTARPAMDIQRARELHFVASAQGKTEENVREHLSDPVNGLGKLNQEMTRHQTAFSKKKKKGRR